MTEPKRITSLFEKLYNGSPWIDVSLVSVLENISSGQAAEKVLKNSNSIWEITHHLIQWRLNVLQRVQGITIKTPSNNYVEIIKDSSPKAWKETLKELKDSQTAWLEFLKELRTEQLETVYEANNMNYYEHIQGIIQHDAYHLGQIVLLAKQVKG